MQIIYPDVLLVVNFCMDYIALYLCGVFVHAVKRKKLLFLSSLLGGVYSVVCIFVSGNSLFNFVLNVSVSLLICYITYGNDIKGFRFFRLVVTFYVISLTLGGAITAFYNLLNNFLSEKAFVRTLYNEESKTYIFLLVSALCSVLIFLFAKLFSANSSEMFCDATITLFGKTKIMKGLVDSGNFLRDPFSGKPVIVVKSELFDDVLPGNIREMCDVFHTDFASVAHFDFCNIRILPVHTVAGNKIMLGIVPEKIEISFVKKEKIARFNVDAIIAIDTVSTRRFEECDAIVPSVLVI